MTDRKLSALCRATSVVASKVNVAPPGISLYAVKPVKDLFDAFVIGAVNRLFTVVQFFFNETKSKDEVSRYWLWDSHRENPVVGFEKRLPYLPQDQRSRTDPYLDIPPRWAVG